MASTIILSIHQLLPNHSKHIIVYKLFTRQRSPVQLERPNRLCLQPVGQRPNQQEKLVVSGRGAGHSAGLGRPSATERIALLERLAER